MNKKQKKMLLRIVAAAILMVALAFAPVDGAARFVAYTVPYLLVGYDILWKALKGIKNRQVFDENFLMAVATVGAIVLAVYSGSGDYTEAVAVMLFYQIGELFQSYAVGKSRRNISELMDIRPDYANIERDGQLEQVDPDEVEIGSVIVVQPGEKVPIDGIVTEGMSNLNTSALTGESLPRDVAPGDEIISGCINMTGVLRIRTTKDFGESTVSKILDLVENASSRKSKSEDFISKFARVYTPAVCISALVLAVAPPVVRMAAMGLAPEWGTWIYRALTFLVISCPCALVISIPLSFFAGIGGASKEGVLVKGSNYLETLSQTNIVVFDKTGTLTQGVFEVNGIHHSGMDTDELIELAALAESASSHPISKSLQKAYGKPIDRSRATDIQEISGHGVIAMVDGRQVAAGNDKLMAKLGVKAIPCHQAGTIIHMAVDGVYAGHIVISDVVKPTSRRAIAALKDAGVRKTVMLTGDAKAVAAQVASFLGIDEVFSQLLPADKVTKVEELLSRKGKKEKLAFVGDGINDAPVLRRADIGIAMGAMGSDAAIEAADVVLMDDDPLKIAKAIRISRKCLGIVYQNIVFAIGVKLLCLALGAVGLANMWLAIFADVGVMILAVLNAIRALFVHNLGGTDYEISTDSQRDDQAGVRGNDVPRRSVAG
ncbi:heavy metal translocating P-type ATPase [Megasphaera butyrica]|uniref:heavy metal translocating P-type ATPase n=1 Tax=Megasphaera butyrica TaxID=2981791 RepID=UPI0008217FE7|nr:heavy metal translocating P-type ATPase [Megasphaera butyrica]MCU6713672.1 heavy metal translocating P-type ATPase [Megasphaera butyrica]SCH10246.1 Cadmium%2C zinc and cobalt-transporting ATPase [uncultured Megasphaera sp.]SCI17294.1 Cadmium%2C zinc and cobalt-transporting ATPase [uncultured Ruminococcus sp.]